MYVFLGVFSFTIITMNLLFFICVNETNGGKVTGSTRLASLIFFVPVLIFIIMSLMKI